MTSHAEGIRDRLGHRHDVTSAEGYVVHRCPLMLVTPGVPLLDSTSSLAVLIQVRQSWSRVLPSRL